MKKRTIIAVALACLVGLLVVTQMTMMGTKSEKACAKAIGEFTKYLKDPDSMTLTSDILYCKFRNGTEIYCFSENSKNGFGAYAGSNEVELICENGELAVFATEDDEYFIGFKTLIETAEKEKDTGLEYKRFKKSRIEKMLG